MFLESLIVVRLSNFVQDEYVSESLATRIYIIILEKNVSL